MTFFSAFGVVLSVALHLMLGYTSAEVTVVQPLPQDTEDGPLKVTLDSWNFKPISVQKEVETTNNEEAVNEPESQVVNEEVQSGTESVLQPLPEYIDDAALKETLESWGFEPIGEHKEAETINNKEAVNEPVTQSVNEEEQTDTEYPSNTTEAITYPSGLIDENDENQPSVPVEEDDIELGDEDLSDAWPATDDDILVFTDADFTDVVVKPSENSTVNRLSDRMLAFENFILENKMKLK